MNKKVFFALHLLLMVYSLGGICSKTAAGTNLLSLKFILCYAGLICILGIYAIGWQQIIKRMPLTTAFANKAVTVVWGIVWGVLFFHETVSLRQVLGAAIVIAGVALYGTADATSAEGEGGTHE